MHVSELTPIAAWNVSKTLTALTMVVVIIAMLMLIRRLDRAKKNPESNPINELLKLPTWFLAVGLAVASTGIVVYTAVEGPRDDRIREANAQQLVAFAKQKYDLDLKVDNELLFPSWKMADYSQKPDKLIAIAYDVENLAPYGFRTDTQGNVQLTNNGRILQPVDTAH